MDKKGENEKTKNVKDDFNTIKHDKLGKMYIDQDKLDLDKDESEKIDNTVNMKDTDFSRTSMPEGGSQRPPSSSLRTLDTDFGSFSNKDAGRSPYTVSRSDNKGGVCISIGIIIIIIIAVIIYFQFL